MRLPPREDARRIRQWPVTQTVPSPASASRPQGPMALQHGYFLEGYRKKFWIFHGKCMDPRGRVSTGPAGRWAETAPGPIVRGRGRGTDLPATEPRWAATGRGRCGARRRGEGLSGFQGGPAGRGRRWTRIPHHGGHDHLSRSDRSRGGPLGHGRRRPRAARATGGSTSPAPGPGRGLGPPAGPRGGVGAQASRPAAIATRRHHDRHRHRPPAAAAATTAHDRAAATPAPPGPAGTGRQAGAAAARFRSCRRRSCRSEVAGGGHHCHAQEQHEAGAGRAGPPRSDPVRTRIWARGGVISRGPPAGAPPAGCPRGSGDRGLGRRRDPVPSLSTAITVTVSVWESPALPVKFPSKAQL